MSAAVGRAALAVEALGRRRRGLLGLVVAVAIAVLAVLYTQAWSTTTYDLHDSGVWVANEDTGQVGRLNTQIPEIDYAQDSGPVEVVQDGRAVYLVAIGSDATTVTQLGSDDPGAEPTVTELTGQAQVSGGGGVLAALVEEEITVIATDGELGAGGQTVEVGADALLAVGDDGTVAGWDPGEGRVAVLDPGADEPRTVDLAAPDGAGREDLSFTLVGDRPVGLVRSGDEPRLLLPGEDAVSLGEHGEVAALQSTGPASGQVVVATDEALLGVGLSDGQVEVREDAAAGEPVRPAVAGGCTYAAWRGSEGAMVVLCSDADPIRGDDIGVGDTAVLRTGGPTVVLNDRGTGVIHLVVDGEIERVSAWPDDEEVPSEDRVFEEDPPNPEDNVAPQATADVGGAEAEGVGARPGRITFLPVLRNDNDPNGDILAVAPDVEAEDEVAEILSVAHDGRSVAVDLRSWPVDETGTIAFRYRATDGELESEPVEVEVEVVTGDAGHDPAVIEGHELDLTVASGQRAEQDVLSVVWDYDGDPLYLASAAGPSGGGHRVTWEAQGRVAIAAGEPGVVPVSLAVRDVTGAEAPPLELQVTVEVPDSTLLGPVLNNDVVAGSVGREITVDPLDNDVSQSGEALVLAAPPEVLRADDPAGLGEVTTSGGSVRFEPSVPGDYVLLYWVEQADRADARATILVRVAGPDERPPVARADVVLVEEGQWAEADLLANDVDPNGDLVAVTDLTPTEVGGAEEGLGVDDLGRLLTASVQSDYRTFRVDLLAAAEPDTYVTFSYVASDGPGTSATTVTVVVVPAAPNRPPDTRTAEVVVRAGDAVTVPLDRFASDPDGDPLEVAVVGQPEVGDAAPSGDTIRYFAPADAGDGVAVVPVEVTEPAGNAQSAAIQVTIIGPDPSSPPRAENLEARVRAGGSVVIPVPLVGLDPDGDDVRLLGRTGASGFDAEVTEDHANQAFVVRTTSATPAEEVTFTYRVVDARGEPSPDATVRVLVTPAGDDRPPVAMVDRLTASTDGEIYVDPVGNDTDLDGDALTLSRVLGREGADELDPVEVEGGSCEAEATDDGLVRITTGDDAEICSITYAVVDVVEEGGEPKSLPQEGQILLSTVGGFPGVRPFARDDRGVAAADRDAVEVDLLRNDDDRDGDPSALEVTLVGAGGEPAAEMEGVELDPATGLATATMGDQARMVRYRITDADGLTADAVMRVPSRAENRPPELRDDIAPIEVRADDAGGATADLRDFIVDPDGSNDALAFTDAQASPKLDSGLLRGSLAEGELVVAAAARTEFGPVTVQVLAVDEEGASASLPIPVTITRSQNVPPRWAGDPCGEVVRDGPARRIPLQADDLDPDDNDSLTFGVEQQSREGVSVDVSGRTLVVQASAEARPNSTVEFTLTVDDGREGGQVPQSCAFKVTRSEAAPLRASPTAQKVEQGQTASIDLTPFVANASGGPTVEDADVQPAGAGRVDWSGSTVRFTAEADAKGPATIRYEVSDDLDAEGERRRASGLIELQIVGRPEPPTGVTAAQSGDDGVTVSWAAGDANGAPISGFEVTGRPGGSKTCDRSPCTLGTGDGIEVDGSSYSFTVVAVNEVGSSEPSGSSAGVELDQPPNAPVDLAVRAKGPGEGQKRLVEFTWGPGETKGSPITGYVLGGALGTGTVPASTTSLEVPVDGDGQILTVAAVNRKGESEAISLAVSGSYGRPAVTDVAVVAVDAERPTATVTWREDGNGAGIASREVTASGCTVEGQPKPEGTRITCSSRTIASLTVTVTNERQVSTTSPPIQGALLERPSVGSVELTARYQSVAVEVTGIDDGGAALSGGSFTLSDGTTGTLSSAGTGTTSVEAGTTVSVTSATMCRGRICSEPVEGSQEVVPYGDPPTASVTVGERDAVTGTAVVTFECTVPDWGRSYQAALVVDGQEVGSRMTGCSGEETLGPQPAGALRAEGGEIRVRVFDTVDRAVIPSESDPASYGTYQAPREEPCVPGVDPECPEPPRSAPARVPATVPVPSETTAAGPTGSATTTTRRRDAP